MNHQGLLWNVHCIATVVLPKQLTFKSAVVRSKRSSCFISCCLRLMLLPEHCFKPQTMMSSREWDREAELKCSATGNPRDRFRMLRRCSLKRSRSRLPVSPMYRDEEVLPGAFAAYWKLASYELSRQCGLPSCALLQILQYFICLYKSEVINR